MGTISSNYMMLPLEDKSPAGLIKPCPDNTFQASTPDTLGKKPECSNFNEDRRRFPRCRHPGNCTVELRDNDNLAPLIGEIINICKFGFLFQCNCSTSEILNHQNSHLILRLSKNNKIYQEIRLVYVNEDRRHNLHLCGFEFLRTIDSFTWQSSNYIYSQSILTEHKSEKIYF